MKPNVDFLYNKNALYLIFILQVDRWRKPCISASLSFVSLFSFSAVSLSLSIRLSFRLSIYIYFRLSLYTTFYLFSSLFLSFVSFSFRLSLVQPFSLSVSLSLSLSYRNKRYVIYIVATCHMFFFMLDLIVWKRK